MICSKKRKDISSYSREFEKRSNEVMSDCVPTQCWSVASTVVSSIAYWVSVMFVK
jgi:hypothetical protein